MRGAIWPAAVAAFLLYGVPTLLVGCEPQPVPAVVRCSTVDEVLEANETWVAAR